VQTSEISVHGAEDPQKAEPSSDCSSVARSKQDRGAMFTAQVEDLAPAKRAITAASDGHRGQTQVSLGATAIPTDPSQFRRSSNANPLARQASHNKPFSKPAELSMTKSDSSGAIRSQSNSPAPGAEHPEPSKVPERPHSAGLPLCCRYPSG
jgi:hypothetical protein